ERARAFFLPGVPHEYRELMQQEVLPRLRALHEVSGAASRGWVSRRLRTVGLGESELAERTRPVLARHPEVVAGFRTDPPENELRLEACADSQEEADALVQAVEKELLPILGDAFYARDETPLAEVVVQGMRNRGQTVALAESCTGGRISVLLTSVSGASDVLSAGAVTYTEEAKDFEASVPRELIDRHGVVSHEVAAAMAIGIRERWKSTFGLSVTGWAGPGGGTERDPVGTAYLGLSGPNGAGVERRGLAGERHQVRGRAAVHAGDLLRRIIQNAPVATPAPTPSEPDSHSGTPDSLVDARGDEATAQWRARLTGFWRTHKTAILLFLVVGVSFSAFSERRFLRQSAAPHFIY